jgi:hypothetical protein
MIKKFSEYNRVVSPNEQEDGPSLCSELSTSTYHNYIRKSKHVIDHTPEESKVHKKAKAGIARAERLLNKNVSEEQLDEISPRLMRSAFEKAQGDAHHHDIEYLRSRMNALRARANGDNEAFRSHATKANEHDKISARRYRLIDKIQRKITPQKLKEEVEVSEEKIRHPEHKKAYVQPIMTAGGPGYKSSNKHGKVKFWNEHGRKSAFKHAEISESVSFSEFCLQERELKTSTYLAAVHWRDTKKPEVRHRKNRKMKGFARLHKTQYVTKQDYKPRSQHDTSQFISRSKHQLTDKWRDQRLVRVKLLKKNLNVHEGKEYLKNRELLHSAHAQAGREIGKRERDPELKRIHLHRSRKHQHAAKVLSILRDRKNKK